MVGCYLLPVAVVLVNICWFVVSSSAHLPANRSFLGKRVLSVLVVSSEAGTVVLGLGSGLIEASVGWVAAAIEWMAWIDVYLL